jgi:hypothetical protein
VTEAVELTDEEVALKLAEIAKRREEKDAAASKQVDRLTVQYSGTLGDEGYHFAVVPTAEGIVVVKRVAQVMSNKLRTHALADTLTASVAYECTVSGVVEPDVATYKRWSNENPLVAITVANSLFGLYVASEGVRKKGR